MAGALNTSIRRTNAAQHSCAASNKNQSACFKKTEQEYMEHVMNLRNMRIGVRMAFGFGIVLAIMVAIIIASSILGEKNRKDLIKGLGTANSKIIMATEMKSLLLGSGLSMRNIGLQTDVSAMQKEEEKVNKLRNEYLQVRNKFQATGLTSEETRMLNNLAAYDKEMEAPFKEAVGQALAFNSEGAGKAISGRIEPITQHAIAEIDQLVAVQGIAAERVLAQVVHSANVDMVIFYLVAAFTIAVGAAVVWTLERSITRPLQESIRIATRVASGELVSDMTVDGKDEISALLAALKEMNTNLVRIVGDVRSGTNSISTASLEIASGNQDLSTRTESQASSLQQTAAAMEELTSTIKQNAESAERANELAIASSRFASEGGKVVGQAIETMRSIQESSRKIVDIISVIDGIAFQTNILALNAAVEAARAGEQGRGFAVVASEVRNLAQRSASAAKEIKILIHDSVQKIQDGSQLVDHAGHSMEKIVNSVEHVATIFNEIKDASHEQSIGVEEVNQAISQIDHMTQLNAALVEEASAAANSLQKAASALLDSVSVFKCDDFESHHRPYVTSDAQFGRQARITDVEVVSDAASRKTRLLPSTLY
jgi:methyl-accepting chemotaxis protein